MLHKQVNHIQALLTHCCAHSDAMPPVAHTGLVACSLNCIGGGRSNEQQGGNRSGVELHDMLFFLLFLLKFEVLELRV